VGIAPPPVQKARIDGNDSGGDRIRRFGFRAHRFRFPSMKGIGVTRNALPLHAAETGIGFPPIRGRTDAAVLSSSILLCLVCYRWGREFQAILIPLRHRQNRLCPGALREAGFPAAADDFTVSIFPKSRNLQKITILQGARSELA